MDMMDGLSCDLMKFILIGLYSLLVDTVCLFLDKKQEPAENVTSSDIQLKSIFCLNSLCIHTEW